MAEYIWTFFTDAASPAINLTPYIQAWNLSNNNQEITSEAMTNIGSSGFYSFDASSLDLSLPIVFRADGGNSLFGFERWKIGGLGDFKPLKKNVELENLSFPMVLSSNHATPAAGKTVTAKIKNDDGSFATCSNSVSEISSGWYSINLTKTERNANVSLLTFSADSCDMRGIVLISE